MDSLHFFLEQYDLSRSVIEGMVLAGLSDEQIRRHPHQGQNSLAWLVWHAARWEDFMITLLDPEQRQLFDQEDWMGRMRLSRRDGGPAMTYEECVAFSAQIDLAELRAYWDAVGRRTRAVALALDPLALDEPLDAEQLRRHFAGGVLDSERAAGEEQFFANRTTAWLLSLINIHLAEHLLGEASCVRSLGGVGL